MRIYIYMYVCICERAIDSCLPSKQFEYDLSHCLLGNYNAYRFPADFRYSYLHMHLCICISVYVCVNGRFYAPHKNRQQTQSTPINSNLRLWTSKWNSSAKSLPSCNNSNKKRPQHNFLLAFHAQPHRHTATHFPSFYFIFIFILFFFVFFCLLTSSHLCVFVVC